MSVRFQADANLNQIILLAARRREPAMDFQTAMGAELSGLAVDDLLLIWYVLLGDKPHEGEDLGLASDSAAYLWHDLKPSRSRKPPCGWSRN